MTQFIAKVVIDDRKYSFTFHRKTEAEVRTELSRSLAQVAVATGYKTEIISVSSGSGKGKSA